MADPVREAIFERLTATPAVTSLLGAANNVFHRVAPRNATPPFIVFHRQSAVDEYMFSGSLPALEHEVWTIKAICRGSSSTAADSIASAVLVALNDAALSVDGYAVLWLRRMSKLDFGERVDAETWHHVGGLWRLELAAVPA